MFRAHLELPSEAPMGRLKVGGGCRYPSPRITIKPRNACFSQNMHNLFSLRKLVKFLDSVWNSWRILSEQGEYWSSWKVIFSQRPDRIVHGNRQKDFFFENTKIKKSACLDRAFHGNRFMGKYELGKCISWAESTKPEESAESAKSKESAKSVKSQKVSGTTYISDVVFKGILRYF